MSVLVLVAVLVDLTPYSPRWPVTTIVCSAAAAVAADADAVAAPGCVSLECGEAWSGTRAKRAAASDSMWHDAPVMG